MTGGVSQHHAPLPVAYLQPTPTVDAEVQMKIPERGRAEVIDIQSPLRLLFMDSEGFIGGVLETKSLALLDAIFGGHGRIYTNRLARLAVTSCFIRHTCT